jgi:hypothetical protein
MLAARYQLIARALQRVRGDNRRNREAAADIAEWLHGTAPVGRACDLLAPV